MIFVKKSDMEKQALEPAIRALRLAGNAVTGYGVGTGLGLMNPGDPEHKIRSSQLQGVGASAGAVGGAALGYRIADHISAEMLEGVKGKRVAVAKIALKMALPFLFSGVGMGAGGTAGHMAAALPAKLGSVKTSQAAEAIEGGQHLISSLGAVDDVVLSLINKARRINQARLQTNEDKKEEPTTLPVVEETPAAEVKMSNARAKAVDAALYFSEDAVAAIRDRAESNKRKKPGLKKKAVKLEDLVKTADNWSPIYRTIARHIGNNPEELKALNLNVGAKPGAISNALRASTVDLANLSHKPSPVTFKDKLRNWMNEARFIGSTPRIPESIHFRTTEKNAPTYTDNGWLQVTPGSIRDVIRSKPLAADKVWTSPTVVKKENELPGTSDMQLWGLNIPDRKGLTTQLMDSTWASNNYRIARLEHARRILYNKNLEAYPKTLQYDTSMPRSATYGIWQETVVPKSRIAGAVQLERKSLTVPEHVSNPTLYGLKSHIAHDGNKVYSYEGPRSPEVFKRLKSEGWEFPRKLASVRLEDLIKEARDKGWLGVTLPTNITRKIKATHKLIDKDDLGPEGFEKDPHITLAYGIAQKKNPMAVKRVVEAQKPVEITLGGISAFHNDDATVLKLSIKSPELNKLHHTVKDKVGMPGSTHPSFKPHLTLAYLKPGTDISKYKDLSDSLEGTTFDASKITYSNDAHHMDLQLK